MRKKLRFCSLLPALLFTSQADAYDLADGLKVTASGRFRLEDSQNKDYSSSTNDHQSFVGSLFRVNFLFTPTDYLEGFFQPQYSPVWGSEESVFSGTSTVTGTTADTSGALRDTSLDVHQAYVILKSSDALSFQIGRQEFVYGDHLVVGSVPWHNVGRSFDAVKTKLSYWKGWSDIFFAKTVERGASSATSGDEDFIGLYNSYNLGTGFDATDLYLLYLSDETTKLSLLTYGLRMKAPISDFDYRLEITAQNKNSATEYQADIEFGYTLIPSSKFRMAAEYFHASDGYYQLYPTAHKWLGYADHFKRQNIKGFRLGLQSNLFGSLIGNLHYHSFMRADTSQPGYNFGGTSLGAVGTSSAMASEIDIGLSYPAWERVALEGGASFVMPGQYLKDNGKSSSGHFFYFQVASKL